MTTPSPLPISGEPLDFTAVEQVARQGRAVALTHAATEALQASRRALESALAGGAAIYGVNTGFGSLSRQRLEPRELSEVQHNLLRSHAAGVGDPLPEPVVRAMMLLLAASLARGKSGVRPIIAQRVIDLLNAGVTPHVPSVGSVGASGDLAPLAHACLVLTGEGHATFRGEMLSGRDALARANIQPVALDAKEGLALINGTHLMAAQAALLMVDAERLFDAALVAVAMSIDACRGSDAFLDPRVYEARAQIGPRRVAARLRAMLAGSTIRTSHLKDDPRVQDPYSLRCAPVVLGSALDAIDFVRAAALRELGAVTDNPLVFETGVVSAGNFHGMPIAIPLDVLSIAIAHVSGISERRTFLMLAASDPESNLRPHLSPRPGLHSGLMITQYVAAACCNEIIGLASPATVANIPTCAGMEDYNSFGPRAAAKAERSLDLCRKVVAIEMLCASQALELHRPLRSGEPVERAHAVIREVVPALTADRPPSPDVEAIAALIRQGRFGD
jgi:histidine ammonia-lyase